MLVHRNRAWALRQMDELGLLAADPAGARAEMKGLPQGPPAAPTGDLWEHTLQVLEVLDGPRWPEPAPVSFPLAFAALLHDVGKPRTVGRDAGPLHVPRPRARRQAAGRRDACRRLKLSNEEADRVDWLVEKHQYLCDAPTMRASKLKPILVHPGIGELLALHRADAVASGRSTEHVEFCERMLARDAAGRAEPAAAADRRRPARPRLGAGAAVQEGARRRPRGPARRHGPDEGRGDSVGRTGDYGKNR